MKLLFLFFCSIVSSVAIADCNKWNLKVHNLENNWQKTFTFALGDKVKSIDLLNEKGFKCNISVEKDPFTLGTSTMATLTCTKGDISMGTSPMCDDSTNIHAASSFSVKSQKTNYSFFLSNVVGP